MSEMYDLEEIKDWFCGTETRVNFDDVTRIKWLISEVERLKEVAENWRSMEQASSLMVEVQKADCQDKELQTWLKQGFLKLNDDHFSNYPKEALAIKQLIKKASSIPNTDTREVLYHMIETFRWKKATGKTDYWRGVPLLPSMLNYRWDQIYESWKLAGANSEVDEFIRGEA